MSNKNPKIKGIVFKHDKNDYSIWMPDFTNDEDKEISASAGSCFRR